jgi:hypothetical protein
MALGRLHSCSLIEAETCLLLLLLLLLLLW